MQDKLNERAKAGYKPFEIIATGGGNIAIVFVKNFGAGQDGWPMFHGRVAWV